MRDGGIAAVAFLGRSKEKRKEAEARAQGKVRH